MAWGAPFPLPHTQEPPPLEASETQVPSLCFYSVLRFTQREELCHHHHCGPCHHHHHHHHHHHRSSFHDDCLNAVHTYHISSNPHDQVYTISSSHFADQETEAQRGYMACLVAQVPRDGLSKPTAGPLPYPLLYARHSAQSLAHSGCSLKFVE